MAPDLRLRCTPDQLAAALVLRGGPGPAAASVDLRGSGLTDPAGALTAEATAVLDVLLARARVLSVVSGSPGRPEARVAVVTAPPAGGPYVFEARTSEHVELVAVTSPSTAVALLDGHLLLSALPGDGVEAELPLPTAAWWALLAVVDALRAAGLAADLERRPPPRTGVDRTGLDHQVAWAQRAPDARWLLGLMAVGDRAAVESVPTLLDEGVAGLEAAGIVVGEGTTVQPTGDGWAWIDLLVERVRCSHLRLTHRGDGGPTDVGSMTVVRTGTATLLAQHGASGTTLLRTDPLLVAAIIREVLAVPVAAVPSADRAFVGETVTVLSPEAGSEVVGTLPAGTAVVVLDAVDGWARVHDVAETVDGWVDEALIVRGGSGA